MTAQLLAFLATSLVVILVPGPDMMLVFRNAARAGRAGAGWTVAGIMTGLAVLGGAAALGLTALLAGSPALFHAVRIAGGVYLVVLGVRAARSHLRSRSTAGTTTAAGPAGLAAVPGDAGASPRECFRQGLVCNLLNPKVGAFYLSLFPQFDLSPLPTTARHAVLAATFWVLCLLWYAALLPVLDRAMQRLRSPAFTRRSEAAAGVALLGLGTAVLVQAG